MIDADHTAAAIDAMLRLPRGEQAEAATALSIEWDSDNEEWNTAFGPDSLFDAWTRCTLLKNLYRSNADFIVSKLREGWTGIEIGGGNGALWQTLSQRGSLPEGTLWVVDPAEEVHQQVRQVLPAQVRVRALPHPVQTILDRLPEADVVVCSLTLHHVAGVDATQRELFGLEGPGKLEVLQAIRRVLEPDGRLILNEADVHCEIDLKPGDPILLERMLDSYVRRCASALVRDIRQCDDAGLRDRWAAVVRRWCVDQLRLASVPLTQRDVYELDVPRWLEVLERAGFHVIHRGFTDDVQLFHQYIAEPK